MLTNQLLSYYNHLLAASIMYLTVVDPLKDIANTQINQRDGNHNYASNLVFADSSQNQDFYEVLGVKKDATKHEIHRAFRQLAKKYHPDKNKDKNASDEFIKIFKAYETLSDETKRKEYDSRQNGYNHASSNSWTTSSMNDFDINEFFRHYEEQFMKHAHHYQDHHAHHAQHAHHHQQQHYQHHNHDGFRFHGINLDDLFNDIDEDELGSFIINSHGQDDKSHHTYADDNFGDGATFFGNFPAHLQESIHQYQGMYGGGYQSGYSYSCHTIKKSINGHMMTETKCVDA